MRRLLRSLIYRTPIHRLFNRVPHTKEFWNTQLSGTLSPYLEKTVSIETRNALTLTLIRQFLDAESILDLGCGTGSLSREPTERPVRYFGVDISDYAIDKARGLSPLTDFDISPLEVFTPSATFDAMVFNEILYYFSPDEVVKQVKRYLNYLSANGGIIVSMKHDPKSILIFSALSRELTWVDGILFQEKTHGIDFKIRFDDMRPGIMVALFKRQAA